MAKTEAVSSEDNFILDEPPTLPQLKCVMRQDNTEFVTKWQDIGFELLNDSTSVRILNEIKSDFHTVNECCIKMFEKWIAEQRKANWNQLITALKNNNLNTTAEYIKTNLRIENGADKQDELVEKQLNARIIVDLRSKYVRILQQVQSMIEEKKYDIKKLIVRLCAADEDKETVFSTDRAFTEIIDTNDLFFNINRYCSMYDYHLLLAFVESTDCKESIKLLDDFSEELHSSIFNHLNLLSEDGELNVPKNFMPGTHKLLIKYVGGKCTLTTKENVQRIIYERFNLKKGTIIFRGTQEGCVAIVYQISNAVKCHLLKCHITPQDALEFANHKIKCIIVDDTKLAMSAQTKEIWLNALQKDGGDGSLYNKAKDTDEVTDSEEKIISKEEFEKSGNVRDAFTALETKMTILLRNADHLIIRRACITQTKAPGGAQLPEELVTKMLMTQNIDTMLDVLAGSPFWSWIDVRLLETIVVASESPLALELLNNYKSFIFSKKLIDVMLHFSGKKLNKEQYTKVVSKVKKSPKEMTVADLLAFQEWLEVDILNIANGRSVLECLAKECTEVHWYIPTECVEKAFHSATLNCYKFHDLQLQFLHIGSYHVIHDPLSTQGPVSQIPAPPTIVGTCKQFIDHYCQHLSVNMDTEVVLQLMISQKLTTDSISMTSSSNYQINYIILELLRKMNRYQLQNFFELLKASKKPPNEKDVAIVEALQSSFLQTTSPPGGDQSQDDSEWWSYIFNREKPSMIKPAAALTVFLDVKTKIETFLRDSDPRNILEQCGCLMASDQHNLPLFSPDIMQQLREEVQTPMLIQMLSPYITWTDHSVLYEMVKACHNTLATEIITQYDINLDSSQPLLDYPIAKPVYQMLPKDNSTQTVLAVQLDLQYQQLSLQEVFDMRDFILKQCEITPHTLQLLSVAQSSSTILYWMIARSVVALVTSKVSQRLTDLHQKGILDVAIYPSTILATGKALSVGPLSFLTCFDEMITSEARDVLNTQLSQLENLPKVVNYVNQLHLELLRYKTAANELVEERDVQMVQSKDTTTQPDSLQDQSTGMSDKAMEVQEMDHVEERTLRYVRSQNNTLRTELKDAQTYTKIVEQQLDKERQKYSTLLNKYEEVKPLFDDANDIQKEIRNIEGSVDEVIATIDKVKRVKMQWTEMVHEMQSVDSTQLKEIDSLLELSDSTTSTVKSSPLLRSTVSVIHLKELNKKMSLAEKHSTKLFSWLLDEMAQLRKEKEEYKVNTAQLNDALSEMESRSKVEEMKFTKLKEDHKLAMKQLSGKRTDQIQYAKAVTQAQQKELLGSGKYGEVTRVMYCNRLCASKAIYQNLLPGYPDVSTDGLIQIIRQIKAILLKVNHPNVEIVEALSQQSPTSTPMLLSELLPYNLDTFIGQSKENLIVDVQIDLCHDMAEGLSYLLAAGILHTNLHSHNVLVSNEPKAKIADYICPHVLTLSDSTVTSVDQSYLAPEVIKSKQPPTEYSTVFSLGVLSLQTVTGHHPRPSDDLELFETERRKQDLQEVDKTNPLLPIIQQCLSDSEGSRPSVSEVPSQIRRERNKYVLSKNVSELPPLVEALQTKKYHIKWNPCADLPRRMHSVSVAVDGKCIYVTAGDAPDDDTYNNVYEYDIISDQWNTLPPPGHRVGVFCMVDDKLSIFGGSDPVSRKCHNKVSTYNRDTTEWTSYYPNMIQKRLKPGVVTHSDHVIVLGGEDDDNKSFDSIEVMKWQERSAWREVSTKLPVPMFGIKPTIVGEYLLIVGYQQGVIRYTGSHQLPIAIITSSSDQVAGKWEDFPVPPHYETTTVPYSNPPLIIGGSDVTSIPIPDIAVYDTSMKSWIHVDSLTSARIAVGLAVINNNIVIVIGGFTKGGNVKAALASTLPMVEIGHIVCN